MPVHHLLPLLAAILTSSAPAQSPVNGSFAFDRRISQQVLGNYLARAVTHVGLCASSADPTTGHFDDDLRMLTRIGAKFIGRAAFVWDLPPDDGKHFAKVAAAAEMVRVADSDIILQAAVFETVATGVDGIPVPEWAFRELSLPVETRNFSYEAMLYDGGKYHNHWRAGSSVPDMSKTETRLWFYYRARRYIDCGIEAIHFGQVELMDDHDPGHRHWLDLLGRVRAYAAKHARRHLVICDAHTHGISENERLLFDFHSFPLRIREIKGRPEKARLASDQPGDIVGRSLGGTAPSGWRCDSLPYLVEFDNYGYSGKGGQSVGGIWVWGYDEISWFARQDPPYRNRWLREAHSWIGRHAPHGHLQMPTRRPLAAPAKDGSRFFRANNPSPACPGGFGLEDTIHSLWRPAPGETGHSR